MSNFPPVLTSVKDVYVVTRSVFPSARGDIEAKLNDEAILRINLGGTLPEMSLEQAIDTEVFVRTLKECMGRQKLGLEVEPEALSPERFALSQPLKGGRSFRRMIFETEGGSIPKALMDYLANPKQQENIEKIQRLVLSPDLIENDGSEEVVEWMVSAIKIACNQGAATHGNVLNSIKTLYPAYFQKIVQSMVQEVRDKIDGERDSQYKDVCAALGRMVIGQNLAKERAAQIITSQLNLRGNEPNNKVFLFAGPTGVGKTEMAKATAKVKQAKMASFFMNQYQQESDVSKLLGSASGYVGSTDKPHIAKEFDLLEKKMIEKEGSKKVFRISNAVILFDELEKAHPVVKQSLLTLFDENFIEVQYTDGSSNVQLRYEFKNSIFVATTNLFQALVLTQFEMGCSIDTIRSSYEVAVRACPSTERHSFSPEFLARMDMIPFGPIARGVEFQKLLKIKLDLFLEKVKMELEFLELKVCDENAVLAYLESKLYGQGYDIRRVGKYLDEVKGKLIATHFGERQKISLELKLLGDELIAEPSVYIDLLQSLTLLEEKRVRLG